MTEASVPPNQEKKPTVITVFGILNIIYCGLGIMGAIAGFLYLFFLNTFPDMFSRMLDAAGQDRLFAEEIRKLMTLVVPYAIAAYGAGVIVHATGLTGGIGLLSGKKWGRTASLVFVALCFTATAASLVFMFLFVDELIGTMQDLMSRIYENIPRFNRSSFNPMMMFPLSSFTKIYTVILALLGSVYPVLLLVFLSTGKAKEYYSRI